MSVTRKGRDTGLALNSIDSASFMRENSGTTDYMDSDDKYNQTDRIISVNGMIMKGMGRAVNIS